MILLLLLLANNGGQSGNADISFGGHKYLSYNPGLWTLEILNPPVDNIQDLEVTLLEVILQLPLNTNIKH